MKRQRGFALLEILIVLALVVLLSAMLGQSLQSVVQARNETNISKALLALQTAEASYIAAYPSSGFATGSALADLSTCPAGGTKATATAACLTAIAYTDGQPVYGYDIAVMTPSDALSCSHAPCGYLAVATPVNPSLGRLTYCADTDGLLHGEISKTPLSITTNAGCGALPAIRAGTPSSAPSGSSIYTTGLVTGTGDTGINFSLTGLPAGTYYVNATASGYVTRGVNLAGNCGLFTNGTTIDLGIFSPTAGNAFAGVGGFNVTTPAIIGFTVPLTGVATVGGDGTINVQCVYTPGALSGETGGSYGVITATPIQTSQIN